MAEVVDPESGEIFHLFHRCSADLGELFAALAKAQGEFAGVQRDATNPHFKSSYATLGAVIDATRDARAKNGLAVIQMPGNYGVSVAVTTLLGHTSGQWIESTVYVAPGKFDAPGVGSVISYLRRYAMMAVFGIAPEDDDGNAAVARPERPAPSPPLRQYPPSSKVSPAVAPQNIAADDGRAAFGRISAKVKAAQNESQCRGIYDELLDEWGGDCVDDILLVNAVSADAVDDLQRRVRSRIQALRAEAPAAAK